MPDGPRRARRILPARARSRRGAAAGGAAAVLVVAIGIGIGVPGSSKGAGTPSSPTGATSVQRRDLIATDTQPGTLSYANPQTVYNRVSGTITQLPTIGAVVEPGQTLYKVDNSPVVLFNGTVPAYRSLSSGVSNGPDVLELNQNLVKLGFAAGQITVNDAWQAGTTAAVDRWQASIGETVTGTVTLGQIVFLPGSQRITAVDSVLGSTGGGSASSATTAGGSGSASTTSLQLPAARPQFVSLTTASTTPSPKATTPKSKGGTSRQKQELAALIALLKAETAALRSGRSSTATPSTGGAGGRGSSGAAGGGGGGGAGASASPSAGSSSGASSAASAQAILQTTSTQRVVSVQLDATKQSEAVVGESVTVQMPDGSIVNGRITKVSPVAQTTSSSSSSGTAGSTSTTSSTVPVTIALQGRSPSAGLDQAAVSVNFQQQKATNVLSVPVTALLATAGGGYAVQEAGAPHQLITVSPGLFAAGYVEISGTGVYPGLQVTDSQG